MQDYPRREEAHGRRGPAGLRRVAAAAFFDLDRTLLRRSSALALAGSFRERGLISRRQLAQAAAWQLLFVARGASHEAVRRAAEDGLRVLRRPPARGAARARRRGDGAGAPSARLCRAAAPRRAHRERGERVFIVSATLQEIVEAIADDLGFDGALGTICEVRGRRVHRSRPAGAARRGQGRLHARACRERGSRPRGVHGVLRQPYRPSVPRSRRASGRRQSRPRAAAHCEGARLAGARVQRARVPACAPSRLAGARRRRRSGVAALLATRARGR